MFTLDRKTKAMSKRASIFTLVMAGIVLAPIAFSSGVSAREGGNGGGGDGGAGGGGGNGGNGGNGSLYSNYPDVTLAAARNPNAQRPGRARGHTIERPGACIGDRATACAIR